MRYHFVLNGYLQNCQKLMQEMKAFKEMYLPMRKKVLHICIAKVRRLQSN